MARYIALFSLFIAHSLCMQMRETVERTVMVRTTGSDLQPAATGFIYKQENDGEAKVIEMGESEVMAHLAQIYKQPKAFAAPIPVAAGPFYANEDDEKAASDQKERVIPVKEEEEVDGIVNDDFEKILKEYKTKLDNPHNYDDSSHSLGNLDEFYHKYDDGDDDKTYKGYKISKQYNDGDAGDYNTEKFESYKIVGGHKKEHDNSDSYGKHFKDIHGGKGGYYGYKPNYDTNNERKAKEFHKYYDNQDKKHIYDSNSNGNGNDKFAHSKYYTSDDNTKDSHEAAHRGDLRKSGEQDEKSGEESDSHSYEDTDDIPNGEVGTHGGHYGQSYGFKIKH